jgi:hypothetical protein
MGASQAVAAAQRGEIRAREQQYSALIARLRAASPELAAIPFK